MAKQFDCIYDGKRCYVASTMRVRHANKSWGFYNLIILRFEDGTSKSVSAAKFAKNVRSLDSLEEH